MKTRNKSRLIMCLLILSLPILILIFGSNDNMTIIALVGSIGLCSFYVMRFVNNYHKIEKDEFTKG